MRSDENGRMMTRVNISDEPYSIDAWCDHKDSELNFTDPRQISTNQNSIDLFNERKAAYEDDILFMTYYEVDMNEWWTKHRLFNNMSGNHFLYRYFSPGIKSGAYFYPYKEWCEEHHPELNPVKCASVYVFLKDFSELDTFVSPNMVNNYNDREKALNIDSIFDNI